MIELLAGTIYIIMMSGMLICMGLGNRNSKKGDKVNIGWGLLLSLLWPLILFSFIVWKINKIFIGEK